jgi:hypothetical protein
VKFFGISENFFSYLGKNMLYPENFFDSQNGTLTENFLATGGEGRLPKNFLSALFFFLKSALQSLPPQLFEASYAPGVHQLDTGSEDFERNNS